MTFKPVMVIRCLPFRPAMTLYRPIISNIRLFHHRFYAAQSTAVEQGLNIQAGLAAQAELAAKAKVLSPYHKVSFDERKVRIPWQDGKTSALYVCLAIYSNEIHPRRVNGGG